MLLLLGSMSISTGDNERAIELFKRAQEVIPFQRSPYLVAISLVSQSFRAPLNSHQLYLKDIWVGFR
jgi:hypothetical protein